MIIVEGMDNSGKTTLCNHLSKELGIKVFSGEIPKGRQGMIMFQISAMFSNRPTIYDRMRVISEMVYGHVIRKNNLFAKDGWMHINMLLKIRPMVIYCRPSDQEIFKFGNREQMDGVIDNSPQLLNRYDDIISGMMKLAERPILCYDWKNREYITQQCSSYSQELTLKDFQVRMLQNMGE